MKIKNIYGEILSINIGDVYQIDTTNIKQYENERITGNVTILEIPKAKGKYILVNSDKLNADVLIPIIELSL